MAVQIICKEKSFGKPRGPVFAQIIRTEVQNTSEEILEEILADYEYLNHVSIIKKIMP